MFTQNVQNFYTLVYSCDDFGCSAKDIQEVRNFITNTFENPAKPMYKVTVQYMCYPVYYRENPLGIESSLPTGSLVFGYRKAGEGQEQACFSIYGPQLMTADEVRQYLATHDKSEYIKQFNPTKNEEDGLFFFDFYKHSQPGLRRTIVHEKQVILRGEPRRGGLVRPTSESMPTTQHFCKLRWHKFNQERDVYMGLAGNIIQGKLPDWFDNARLGFVKSKNK